MAPAINLTRALRFFNIMLATNLILLSNDVALNSGPIDVPVPSQGKEIGDWAIEHVTGAKFELSMSLNSHKDALPAFDVLILTKTFCSSKRHHSFYQVHITYFGRTELVRKGEEFE